MPSRNLNENTDDWAPVLSEQITTSLSVKMKIIVVLSSKIIVQII